MSERLLSAAAVIMMGNILSRLLGLVREQVMAAYYGATGATDAFVAAAAVPTIVYDLLVGGAISAALVPVFVDYADPDQEDHFWRTVSVVLTVAALALGVVAALLMVLAEPVIWLVGTGFQPQQRELGVLLVRVGLAAVVFQGLAGVLMAVLYARQRFALPAFASAAYNAGIILGVVLLAGMLGVIALVAGVLLGALAQLLLQVAGLRSSLARCFRPALDFGHPEMRTIGRLYAPVAAGMMVTIIGIVIDRNLASRLDPGDMTVMRYATTLVQFPLGLVATATSFAVLPTLAMQSRSPGAGPMASGRLGDGGAGGYQATLAFGIKMVLLLMVPATVGLVVLREPLVRLIFQRGAFTPDDTVRTAWTFLAYAPQLPFTALDQLLIFAFYARKDTRTPVLVGVGTVLLYVATALPLMGWLGVYGLAAANAIQNSAHGLVLLALLHRAVGGVVTGDVVHFAGKVVLAVAGMGLGLWWLGTAGIDDLPLVVGGIVGGGAVYVGLAVLLGVKEVGAVMALARTRVGAAIQRVDRPGVGEG